MDRRAFLEQSAVGIAGLLLGGCGRRVESSLAPLPDEPYVEGYGTIRAGMFPVNADGLQQFAVLRLDSELPAAPNGGERVHPVPWWEGITGLTILAYFRRQFRGDPVGTQFYPDLAGQYVYHLNRRTADPAVAIEGWQYAVYDGTSRASEEVWAGNVFGYGYGIEQATVPLQGTLDLRWRPPL